MNKGVENMTNVVLENFFIGKTKTESFKYCKENNLEFRVVRKNDVPCIITCDFRPDRLNFEIYNNIKTKVYTG